MKKKLLLALAIIAPLFITGALFAPGLNIHDHSSATQGGTSINGATITGGACAAGYTRLGSNFCYNNNPTEGALGFTAGCTVQTFLDSVPAEATHVLIYWRITLAGQSAVALRQLTVSFWGSGCAGNRNNAHFDIKEFVASTGSIAISSNELLVRPHGTGQISTTMSRDGTSAHTFNWRTIGYWD